MTDRREYPPAAAAQSSWNVVREERVRERGAYRVRPARTLRPRTVANTPVQQCTLADAALLHTSRAIVHC